MNQPLFPNQTALETLFQKGLKELSLDLTKEQQEHFFTYLHYLEKWNHTHNLTALKDPEEMIIKHFLDSLTLAKHLEGECFIDVGTGAGFPGIPLALVMNEKQFHLLDSSSKRTAFLQRILSLLPLKNVKIITAKVEDYQPETLYDGVLTRAFSSLTEMVNKTAHLLKPGGLFFAMKGEVPQAELDNLPQGVEVLRIIRLTVPEIHVQRHLIVLQGTPA